MTNAEGSRRVGHVEDDGLVLCRQGDKDRIEAVKRIDTFGHIHRQCRIRAPQIPILDTCWFFPLSSNNVNQVP